jgi:hypothetical protein
MFDDIVEHLQKRLVPNAEELALAWIRLSEICDLDIMQELYKADAWLEANGKRKRNYARYYGNWMNKATRSRKHTMYEDYFFREEKGGA